MAQPVAYVPVTSFIGYQGSQPWFPGQNIDIELNALKATTDQVRANLALIQRDDGALVNGSVGWLQLDAATQLAFTTGIAASGISVALTDGQVLVGQTSSSPLAKTLSGDATLAKTGALTIANSAVTYAKLQQIAASSLIGNPTVGVAAAQAIGVGANLTFNGTALQTLAMSGDVTSPANSFVTTVAKIQGITVTGATGTGNIVFSDSPNFSTVALVGHNAIGAVYADGLILINQTAAAAGVQQFSPAFRSSAQGWRTNATARSEQVDWTVINEPVQGVADPTSNLTYNFQVNGGGYAREFAMRSDGVFNALTGYTINGGAASGNVLRGNGTNFVSATLAAADLSDTKTGSGSVVLATSPTLVTPVLGVASGTSLTLANGTANGLQLTAAAGTNGGLTMGAGGTLIFVLGSTVDTFAVNDHSANTVFSVQEVTPGTANTTQVTTPGTVGILNTTAIPAGGTAAKGFLLSSTANFGIFFGSGAPTLSAAQGSLYLRSDGSSTSTRMYVNTNGSTTWTNVTTAA